LISVIFASICVVDWMITRNLLHGLTLSLLVHSTLREAENP